MISDQNIFVMFYRSTSHQDNSYQVSSQLSFWFRRRRAKDFQDGRQGLPTGCHLGFLIRIILAIFDLQVTCHLQGFKSTDLSIQEKKRKIHFHDGHLGFQIRMILAIFDIQIMLSTKFQVSSPFGSGEEGTHRFSRLWPLRPSWISDRNNFSYFRSASHPDASYQV